MRSFGSLAFKQVRARRLRSLLTTAGIVLGVAMILGVLLLTVTIHRTFNDLFDSVYGRTDLIVSGVGGDSVRHSTLGKVRRTPHVDEAQGQVTSVFTLVDRAGVGVQELGGSPGERGVGDGHFAVCPPSTGIVTPVTNPASSLARVSPGSIIETYFRSGDESAVAVCVPPS